MNRITETVIEAGPRLPVIRTTRCCSGMEVGVEVGVDEGCATLDRMIIDGAV